jgi:hypothetical protein
MQPRVVSASATITQKENIQQTLFTLRTRSQDMLTDILPFLHGAANVLNSSPSAQKRAAVAWLFCVANWEDESRVARAQLTALLKFLVDTLLSLVQDDDNGIHCLSVVSADSPRISSPEQTAILRKIFRAMFSVMHEMLSIDPSRWIGIGTHQKAIWQCANIVLDNHFDNEHVLLLLGGMAPFLQFVCWAFLFLSASSRFLICAHDNHLMGYASMHATAFLGAVPGTEDMHAHRRAFLAALPPLAATFIRFWGTRDTPIAETSAVYVTLDVLCTQLRFICSAIDARPFPLPWQRLLDIQQGHSLRNLAIAESLHPRLGANAPISGLGLDILRQIVAHI